MTNVEDSDDDPTNKPYLEPDQFIYRFNPTEKSKRLLTLDKFNQFVKEKNIKALDQIFRIQNNYDVVNDCLGCEYNPDFPKDEDNQIKWAIDCYKKVLKEQDEREHLKSVAQNNSKNQQKKPHQQTKKKSKQTKKTSKRKTLRAPSKASQDSLSPRRKSARLSAREKASDHQESMPSNNHNTTSENQASDADYQTEEVDNQNNLPATLPVAQIQVEQTQQPLLAGNQNDHADNRIDRADNQDQLQLVPPYQLRALLESDDESYGYIENYNDPSPSTQLRLRPYVAKMMVKHGFISDESYAQNYSEEMMEEYISIFKTKYEKYVRGKRLKALVNAGALVVNAGGGNDSDLVNAGALINAGGGNDSEDDESDSGKSDNNDSEAEYQVHDEHFENQDNDPDNQVEESDNQVEQSDNQVDGPDNQVEQSDNPVVDSDNPVEVPETQDDRDEDSVSSESVIDTDEVSTVTVEKPGLLLLHSNYARMDENATKGFNVECAAKFIDYLSFLVRKDSAEARLGSGTKDNTVPLALFTLGLTLAVVSAKFSIALDPENEEKKCIKSLLDKWKNIGHHPKNVRNVRNFPWYEKIAKIAGKIDRKLTIALPSSYENTIDAFQFKFENKLSAIKKRQKDKGDQFENDLKQYNPALYSFLTECNIDYPKILENNWSKRNPKKPFEYTLPPP